MPAKKLEQIFKQINNKSLPPVHLWNPELTGDMDMRIAADGNWFYRGSVIERARMVKLFSTILKREQDQYYLVTPVEKYRIEVEDAPFIAVEVDLVEDNEPHLVFRTNVDDQVIADSQHPILVNTQLETGEPRPYVHIRNDLYALMHRNVFYHLVEIAQQQSINGSQQLVVYSAGECFSLGQL